MYEVVHRSTVHVSVDGARRLAVSAPVVENDGEFVHKASHDVDSLHQTTGRADFDSSSRLTGGSLRKRK